MGGLNESIQSKNVNTPTCTSNFTRYNCLRPFSSLLFATYRAFGVYNIVTSKLQWFFNKIHNFFELFLQGSPQFNNSY